MELFYQWIRDVLSVLQKNETIEPNRIAIDGKAVRAAATNGGSIPYIISAYLGNYGLSIGQLKAGEKTNEVKEMLKLLKKLDISKAGNLLCAGISLNVKSISQSCVVRKCQKY